MIGTSWWEYLFIRSCIVFLHFIAPISVLYTVSRLVILPSSSFIPTILEFWTTAETLFFVLFYMPRYYVLQHQATHPPSLSREERRVLFQKCHDSVKDPESYLRKWFKNAPSSQVRRENVKEFFCWAFLNKSTFGLLEDEELEEYTSEMERILGRSLPPGKGNAISLRLTLDKVEMLHRSLLWYLVRCDGDNQTQRNTS